MSAVNLSIIPDQRNNNFENPCKTLGQFFTNLDTLIGGSSLQLIEMDFFKTDREM